MAIGIREHNFIKPITLGGGVHKISLYADDIALFVSEPEQLIPHLLKFINLFGEVSGYTINWQKSDLIPFTTDLDPTFLATTNSKTGSDSIKYLGIKISRTLRALFKINFMEKLNRLKGSIERWRMLPISLIGFLYINFYIYFKTFQLLSLNHILI